LAHRICFFTKNYLTGCSDVGANRAWLLSKDGAHDSLSTMRHEARIVMNVHVRVGFDDLDGFTPTRLSNPLRMNNLLKHHS
jgi:hypothetical protein